MSAVTDDKDVGPGAAGAPGVSSLLAGVKSARSRQSAAKPAAKATAKPAATTDDVAALRAEIAALKAEAAKRDELDAARAAVLAGRESPAEAAKAEAMIRQPDQSRLYKLTIFPTSENDRGDVFIGVNGYAYTIQRGKEVVVPQAVVDVLNNAVITTMRYFPDEPGKKPEPMQIHNYPFSAVPVN